MDIVLNLLTVAPYVGAWIETLKTQKSYSDVLSHPTWVRGLKLRLAALISIVRTSHPTWVRGLKPAVVH